MQLDESLLRLLAEGDKSVPSILLRRYAPLARTVARRIVRKAAEADLLAEKVFIFLSEKAVLFKGSHGTARSLVLRAAYHRAFHQRSVLAVTSLYGHRSSDRYTLAKFQEQSESSFIEGCHRHYRQEFAIGLWQLLSPSQILTMGLHFFEGHTLEEIADRLDQRVEHIRHHYYRAIEKVRRAALLSNIGVDWSGAADWESDHDIPALKPNHADDYFAELCALWSTGSLSPGEWHHLDVHLSRCSPCQEIKAQYDHVVASLIPALASWLSNVEPEEPPDPLWLDKAEETLLRSIG